MLEPDLIRRARRGDARAQEELFHANRDGIHRVALRMMGDVRDAEEITLDTFHSAFRSLDRFDGRSSFATWCYRIATNRSLDRLRKRERRAKYHENLGPSGLELLPDTGADSHAKVLKSELWKHVEIALDRLSPDIRATVVLKDVEGLGYNEIAEILECAPGTVASRLARGRIKIASYLESIGIDGSYFQSA